MSMTTYIISQVLYTACPPKTFFHTELLHSSFICSCTTPNNTCHVLVLFALVVHFQCCFCYFFRLPALHMKPLHIHVLVDSRSMSIVTVPFFFDLHLLHVVLTPTSLATPVHTAPPASFVAASHSTGFCFFQSSTMSPLTHSHQRICVDSSAIGLSR